MFEAEVYDQASVQNDIFQLGPNRGMMVRIVQYFLINTTLSEKLCNRREGGQQF